MDAARFWWPGADQPAAQQMEAQPSVGRLMADVESKGVALKANARVSTGADESKSMDCPGWLLADDAVSPVPPKRARSQRARVDSPKSAGIALERNFEAVRVQ